VLPPLRRRSPFLEFRDGFDIAHHARVHDEPASTSAEPGGFVRPGAIRLVRRLAVAATLVVSLSSFTFSSGLAVAPPSRPVAMLSPVALPAARPPFGSAAPEADTAGSPDAARLINFRRPLDAPPGLGRPFGFAGAELDRGRALACLAAAAWYEAGDDAPGERAVIQVVLNRLRHGAYPASVCGVVFQGAELATGCQFTFACDGALARRPSGPAWDRARALAWAALEGAVDPVVGEATHYHANYVYPYWAPSLTKIATVGAHVFYRFPGRSGGKAAALLNGPEPVVTQLTALVGEEPSVGPSPLPVTAASAAALVPAHPTPLASGLAAGGNAILLAVDPAVPAGRWAMDALSRCAGKSNCQVIGWKSAVQLESNRARPLEQRDVPAFIFIRNAASRSEFVLWDCALVPRPDPRQCMPGNAAAVRRLLQIQVNDN
jgi:hypothetical protein